MVLPEETKQKRQQEIINAEKEPKNFKRKRFGTDGDFIKKEKNWLNLFKIGCSPQLKNMHEKKLLHLFLTKPVT